MATCAQHALPSLSMLLTLALLVLSSRRRLMLGEEEILPGTDNSLARAPYVSPDLPVLPKPDISVEVAPNVIPLGRQHDCGPQSGPQSDVPTVLSDSHSCSSQIEDEPVVWEQHGTQSGVEVPGASSSICQSTASCSSQLVDDSGVLEEHPVHSALVDESPVAPGGSVVDVMALVEQLEAEGRLVEASALMATVLQPNSRGPTITPTAHH